MKISNQTNAMETDITEQEREALRRDLIEGCAAMWDVYLEMVQDYEPLEDEAARLFDAQ